MPHWFPIRVRFAQIKLWVVTGGILLSLANCGQDDRRNLYRVHRHLHIDELVAVPLIGYVNPAFRRYVHRFEKISGRNIMDDIAIDFGKTDNDEAAHCLVDNFGMGVPRITVSKHHWQEFDQDHERELIIFHELGHCVLRLGHSKRWGTILSFALQSQACAPLSVMYPEADFMLLDSYRTNRDYYVADLIGRSIDEDAFAVSQDACSTYPDHSVNGRAGFASL